MVNLPMELHLISNRLPDKKLAICLSGEEGRIGLNNIRQGDLNLLRSEWLGPSKLSDSDFEDFLFPFYRYI